MCSPADFRVMTSTARTRNDVTTPAANVQPSWATLPGCSSALETKPSTLRLTTGSTHGITFRMIPPRNASTRNLSSPSTPTGSAAAPAASDSGRLGPVAANTAAGVGWEGAPSAPTVN
jgi:hypothetical protein